MTVHDGSQEEAKSDEAHHQQTSPAKLARILDYADSEIKKNPQTSEKKSTSLMSPAKQNFTIGADLADNSGATSQLSTDEAVILAKLRGNQNLTARFVNALETKRRADKEAKRAKAIYAATTKELLEALAEDSDNGPSEFLVGKSQKVESLD